MIRRIDRLIHHIQKLLFAVVLSLVSVSSYAAPNTSKNNIDIRSDLIQQGQMYRVSNDADLISLANSENLSESLNSFEKVTSPSPFGDTVLIVVPIVTPADVRKWAVHGYGSVVEQIQVTFVSDEHGATPLMNLGELYRNEYDFHYAGSLQLIPNHQYTLFIKLQSQYFYAPLRLELQAEKQFDQQARYGNVLMLLCFGIGLALALYNLFIWAGSKDRTHLYYALFTFCWIFGWAQVFHIPKDLFEIFNAYQWHWIGFLLLPITNSLFFIYFLKLKTLKPKLAKWALISGWLSVFTIPLAMVSPGSGMLSATIFTGVNMVFGLYAGTLSMRSGYKPARYFLFAYIVMLVPNMLGNMMNLGVVPALNVNVYLLGLLGTTGDALLLAFALAYRIRLLNEDNIALNQTLESKVQQRTLALEQTAAELKQANLAKNQFLANTSHEIRTPLTSIIGFSESLKFGEIPSHKKEQTLELIIQNGRHLINVIDDILDISKIEADQLVIEQIDMSLPKLLKQVEQSVLPLFKQNGLTLEMSYHWPLPEQIQSDPTRLRQILLNLLHNALKFTENGKVQLSVFVLDDMLYFEVEDSGIGMSENQRDSVFEAFRQADSSTTRQFGGTGLGLTIAKKLANALGGDISVKSTLGLGSTFLVSIQLKVIGNLWLNNQVSLDACLDFSHAPADKRAIPKLKGRVLLAEDHDDSRLFIRSLLVNLGLEVVDAINGQEAYELAQKEQPDLILMDIQMPVLDGKEALKLIQFSGISCPVIALTANVLSHEVTEYKALGFDDVLAKPVERGIFIEKVSFYLNQQDSDVSITLPAEHQLRFYRQYLESLPSQLNTFLSISQSSDYERLRRSAHQIKGGASLLGFNLLAKYADMVERAIKQGMTEQDIQRAVTDCYEVGELCCNVPLQDIAVGIFQNNGQIADLFIAMIHTVTDNKGWIEELKRISDWNMSENGFRHNGERVAEDFAHIGADKVSRQLNQLINQRYFDVGLQQQITLEFERLEQFVTKLQRLNIQE